jgi:hypothetical protein
MLAVMKTRWLVTSLAVAAGIAGVAVPERHAPGRAALQLVSITMPEPAGLRAALPARQTLAKARTDPFAPRSWIPPAPPAPVQAAPEPAAGPSVPPNPYRFAGTVHYAGSLKAVFIRDERVYTATAGEALDGGYRVLSVRRDAVTLVYTPLGIEQRIAFAPDIAPDTPAAASPLAAR